MASLSLRSMYALASNPLRFCCACCACGGQVKKNGSKIQVEVDVNYKTNYESNYWRGILDAQGKTDGGYY